MPVATKVAREKRSAAYAEWAASERERVRRQRTYLTSLSGPLRDAMVTRMLDRAWTLLESAECEAADALLEFVPAEDAERLLAEFFPDAE